MIDLQALPELPPYGMTREEKRAFLARELGVSQAEITKCGGASRLIVGTNKDKLEEVQDK